MPVPDACGGEGSPVLIKAIAFGNFKAIEKELDTKVYFAGRFAAWQRGRDESANDSKRDNTAGTTRAGIGRLANAPVAKGAIKVRRVAL